MRVFFVLWWASSAIFACDCIGPKVHAELDRSDVVFRGVVTNVMELPSRPDLHRQRSAITFSVSKYWKGSQARKCTIHVMDIRGDCLGARFTEGVEYIVFAQKVAARDVRIGNYLWIGWLDLMQEGAEFFTAHETCSNTSNVRN